MGVDSLEDDEILSLIPPSPSPSPLAKEFTPTTRQLWREVYVDSERLSLSQVDSPLLNEARVTNLDEGDGDLLYTVRSCH